MTGHEESLIGGLLVKPENLPLVDLPADAFSSADLREILTMMRKLESDGITPDAVAVASRLPDLSDFVLDLAANATGANLSGYARLVREDAKKRKLMQAAMAISGLIGSADERIEEARSLIDQVADLGGGRQTQHVRELFPAFIEHLEAVMDSDGLRGIPSGLEDLDAMTGGFDAGSLVIVAGRPSMGKSSLAQNIALAASSVRPTVLFSAETTNKSNLARMIANFGDVDLGWFQTPTRLQEEATGWVNVQGAMKRLADLKLYMDDTSAPTLEHVRSRTLGMREKPGLVIVDYLQLMRPPKSANREEEIRRLSSGLKSLAKDADCCVIALSQLNRSLEQRACKRPLMSDLRDSGSIEQDADLILFLYRDAYYTGTDDPTTEIIIAKQREGKTGVVPVLFNGAKQRFEKFSGQYIPKDQRKGKVSSYEEALQKAAGK